MSYSAADRTALDNNTLNDTSTAHAKGDRVGRGTVIFDATDGVAIGTTETALDFPAGAVIKRVFYKVLDTFTSGTDAGTIALQVVGANDVVSALAISDGSNIWDASGPAATILVDTPATFLETSDTARETLDVAVAVEALTAGKMQIWAEWEMDAE